MLQRTTTHRLDASADGFRQATRDADLTAFGPASKGKGGGSGNGSAASKRTACAARKRLDNVPHLLEQGKSNVAFTEGVGLWRGKEEERQDDISGRRREGNAEHRELTP